MRRPLALLASLALLNSVALASGDPAASSTLNLAPAAAAPDEPKGPPPVFSALAFKDLLEQNKTAEGLLVVKFTAEWCGPCKLMDRTTWRDANVVAWFKDHGVALQVDVDKQQDIAREYGVRAMPTMIAFKKGEPVDRVVGYRDSANLLTWVENVRSGKTDAKRLEDAAKNAGDDTPINERLDTAKGLVNAGKFDAATKEYVWLWKNMEIKQPSMAGVRVSFTLNEIQDLCTQHPPAQQAFAAIRDEAEARLKTDNKTWEDLRDWVALNEATRQTEKTIEWFDRIKDDMDSRPTLDRMAYRIQPLLESRGRWADVGRLISKPVERVQQDHAIMKMSLNMPNADAALKARVMEMAKDNFRTRTASLYAGLLAAKRIADASALAAEATKLDDTPQMRLALVRRALELDQPHDSQAELLDQAQKAAGEDKALADQIAATQAQLKTALAKHAG